MKPRPPPAECWINVYRHPYGGVFLGSPCLSAHQARLRAKDTILAGRAPLYRLHVRLKAEDRA